jgi:hypothetical protein
LVPAALLSSAPLAAFSSAPLEPLSVASAPPLSPSSACAAGLTRPPASISVPAPIATPATRHFLANTLAPSLTPPSSAASRLGHGAPRAARAPGRGGGRARTLFGGGPRELHQVVLFERKVVLSDLRTARSAVRHSGEGHAGRGGAGRGGTPMRQTFVRMSMSTHLPPRGAQSPRTESRTKN